MKMNVNLTATILFAIKKRLSRLKQVDAWVTYVCRVLFSWNASNFKKHLLQPWFASGGTDTSKKVKAWKKW